MKKSIKIFLFASLLMLAFSTTSSAQCEAKRVNLSSGSITLTGKTGGCVRFASEISEGQKVTISLTSADGKSRFDLQDGADDETGSKLYSNRTSFSGTLTFTDFSVEIKGTASATYTLKITVTDE